MSEGIVICIDDNQQVLVALRSKLEEALGKSVEVECFENPEEALSFLENLKNRNVPIVIIADEIMPGHDQGSRLFKDINEKYPWIKKILLTGKAGYDDIGFAFKEGNADAYFGKPWDEEKLILTIKDLLELKEDEILEAIEDVVKRSPHPEKIFLITTSGEKYSLEELYNQIKKKTPIGLAQRKAILETIIDSLASEKIDEEDLKRMEAEFFRGE
ncbi:MAG: response regulator [bacterium]